MNSGNGQAAPYKTDRRKLWNARGASFIQMIGITQMGIYETVHMLDMGISETMIGIILAIENGLIIFTSPFWGRVADKYRIYRRLVAIGCLGIGGTLTWFAFCDTTLDFFIYAIMRGVLTPLVMGIMPALALANLSKNSQGQGYGGYRAYGSAGCVVAALLLPVIFSSIPPIAVTAAILMPLSLIFVFSLDKPAPRTASEEASFKGKLPVLLYWFLAAHFLVSLTMPAVNGFYNSFARTLGSPLEWIGVISALNGFVGFIFLPIMGKWVDLRGAKMILILGFAAQALRLLTASYISSPEWLWIPHTFHIFGWAGREVATIVFVTMLAGPAKRATAVTLTISIGMAGTMVGSLLMGSLSDLFGYPIMFRIISAITFLGLFFLIFVLRRYPARRLSVD